MKMCQKHWDLLRKTVNSKGGHDFIATSTKEALRIMHQDMTGAPKNKRNYDPLLASYWSICGNVMDLLVRIGQNPLVLLMENTENPDMECPICYANFLSAEHDRTCTNPECQKEKGSTYEWMIDRAADDAMTLLKTLPD